MKKYALVSVMAAFMLTTVSFATAYDIKIYTDKEAVFEVYGNHLFWQQVDCTVTVSPGTPRTCKMPGGICMYSIKATFTKPGGKITNNNIRTAPIIQCENYSVTLSESWSSPGVYTLHLYEQ